MFSIILQQSNAIAAIENIEQLHNEIDRFLRESKNKRELLLTGAKLTLIGPPNVGKSSILNILGLTISRRNLWWLTSLKLKGEFLLCLQPLEPLEM